LIKNYYEKNYQYYLYMILSTVSYSQVANTPVDLILCDVDNDGFTQFDLESQTAQVLGAQDPTQFNCILSQQSC
jgi:hypothetical protein